MERQIYSEADSRIAGGLTDPHRIRVRFTNVFSFQQKTTLAVLGTLIALINLGFIFWFLSPSHIQTGNSVWVTGLAITCFISILVIELIRIIQAVTLWLFAANSVDPVPYSVPNHLKVAILTTIVPNKEPIELVRRTLVAMRNIKYDGQVDVWILDEGDDAGVKQMAREIGVHYFTRKGIAHFNQPNGEFKAKSKAGNHNSWRSLYEDNYEVVAQMDPDHIPLPNFLERTLGYFYDENIAFVVAPQVYGNQTDRWLTRASASQAYIFHGIIQRGGNGFGSPLLIGTNHLYRPVAWKQIGGYQDSIIEDHLTSMKIHGTINPRTREYWTSVYTPDVISVGEGPTSWSDYFNQQKRWAYGIWEIVLSHSRGMRTNLRPGQKLSYAALQFFYPSVAIVWLLGNFVSAVYFLIGVSSMNVNLSTWFYFWSLSLLTQLGLFTWLNRFNLTGHEQRHGGIDAMLLTMFTAPVYVAAAIAALARRPLAYAVTAKGSLSSADSWHTYRQHIGWAAFAACLSIIGFVRMGTVTPQTGWALFTVLITVLPVISYIWFEKLTGGLQQSLDTIRDGADVIKGEIESVLVYRQNNMLNFAPAYAAGSPNALTYEAVDEPPQTPPPFSAAIRKRPQKFHRQLLDRDAALSKYVNYNTRGEETVIYSRSAI